MTVSDSAFAARSVTRWTGTPPSIGSNRPNRGFGDEDLDDEIAPQRRLDEIGPLGEEACGAAPSDVAVQLDRRRHPVGALGERQAASPDGGRVDVLGQRTLGDLDQRGEGGRVADGDLGEVLAVHLDTGGLQALDQPVVGDVVGAGRSVDPGDPQLAELALAGTPVTVGIRQ